MCCLVFQQDEVYHIEIVELLAKLMNNSSKTSTVQIKRIKPSIIYRLLLIGLGSPMVIYGLVRPLTIETRDYPPDKTRPRNVLLLA